MPILVGYNAAKQLGINGMLGSFIGSILTFFFQSPRPFLNSISLYFVVIISVEYVFIIN